MASSRKSEAASLQADSLAQAEETDKDAVVPLSVRFKHGVHTIFLIVDPHEPFSNVTDALLEAVQERYPKGLTASVGPRKAIPAPATVVYALPKNRADPSQGWQRLKISETDTPKEKGLEEGGWVAFALLAPGQDEAEAEFEVTLPTLDDE